MSAKRPRDPLLPRRVFTPAQARRIRLGSIAISIAALAYWALMGAIFGRMLGLW